MRLARTNPISCVKSAIDHPSGVGRELVSFGVVELLDGPNQRHIPPFDPSGQHGQIPRHDSFGELLRSAVAIFLLEVREFVQRQFFPWPSVGKFGWQILKMDVHFYLTGDAADSMTRPLKAALPVLCKHPLAISRLSPSLATKT